MFNLMANQIKTGNPGSHLNNNLKGYGTRLKFYDSSQANSNVHPRLGNLGYIHILQNFYHQP